MDFQAFWGKKQKSTLKCCYFSAGFISFIAFLTENNAEKEHSLIKIIFQN